jgi:aryl-alcohol dehydrogenase-like predicted oxidoreductase
MITRPLGRTGLIVSRIGLGLAALGRPGYINLGHADDLSHDYDINAMKAHAHSVLDAAWECGLRYFDAARSYGRGEEFLAAWLDARNIEPPDVVIGSKWGYMYTAGWQVAAEKHEVKDHSLPVLKRQYAESVGLLGSHLDLYQIHSATLESGVLDDRNVLDELARLRDSGLKIGLSVSGPRQSETILSALETQTFDCVQATWNLLEPSAGSALATAHDAGLGVIVKESLANGRLTDRNNDPDFSIKRRILDDACRRRNCALDALAIAAVLAQPWADVVLSGAATVEQLRSNLRAIDVRWGDELTRVIQQFAEPSIEYWSKRGQLAWN